MQLEWVLDMLEKGFKQSKQIILQFPKHWMYQVEPEAKDEGTKDQNMRVRMSFRKWPIDGAGVQQAPAPYTFIVSCFDHKLDGVAPLMTDP